ncbi:hypothetical protein [Alkalihalobacillus trypoxylicola]|uniref:Hydrolase n=1 Tax=Alkalihalobacillus trypoxylicola TaxID=519424 RepID=A0A161PHL2_9BACI|nr:hypothetical protein [Alkalihalobacillus trypoxylicola]KYG32374.1 hypothetical protein AZF04_06325 [Alkalihalobacillus trypoxylicola]GAF64001.1 hypothetical protein BTS2_0893 [Bacillus sp. TS-2]
MSTFAHYFYLEDQANVVYLPYRPNGFAIILLSENERPVEKDSSIWQQHPERQAFLNSLIEEGYTVITSQLFGKHWGSKKAVQYLEKIHHQLIKKQILNQKFHLFAEGMGALVALKLMEHKKNFIRSVFLLNPCIYVDKVYVQEKSNKLFYKRFVQEFAMAHDLKESQVTEEACKKVIDFGEIKPLPPIQIYQLMTEKKYPMEVHSRPFEKACHQQNENMNLSLYGLGKSFSSFLQPVCTFYKKNEKKL